jgi:hypothetical protein
MADHFMARAHRTVAALAPFLGIVVIIIAGKRW